MADINLGALQEVSDTLADAAFVSTHGGSTFTDTIAVSLQECVGVPLTVPVIFDAAWPSRPTLPADWVVLWIGDTGGSGPTEMLAGDIWTRA